MPTAASSLPCVLALCAVLVTTGPVHATVYKCLVEDGKVFYQDVPCAPGRELRDFDKEPGNVSVVPFEQPAPSAKAAASGGKATAGAGGKATAGAGGKAAAAAKASGTTSKAAPRSVPRPESRPARKVPERGDAAQRKFLRPGMSEGEVITRVGPPDMTSSAGRKGTRWTYMPVPEDAHTITNLQFDNGRLVEVERKVLR